MVCVCFTSRLGSLEAHRTRILHPSRPRRPRAIIIGHLALKGLDVCGVGIFPDIVRGVIIIRPNPVVCVYFIRHVRPVTVAPLRVVHEIHAFGLGVAHTLRARPRRRTSVHHTLESILIDGITSFIGVVTDSTSEF